MKTDPIPTFRRTAGWLRRTAISRTLWKNLRTSALVAVAVAALGLLAAATSRRACESKTRQTILAHLAFSELQPEWADESSLHPVPFPTELLDSEVYAHESRSIFRPAIAYRADSRTPTPPIDRPAEAWAYVKCRVGLPFVVRAHYGWGWDRPVNHGLRGAEAIWSRGGTFSEGVLTYACAFGIVVPINDWAVGEMFN